MLADLIVRWALFAGAVATVVAAVSVPLRHPEWHHGRRVSLWLWIIPASFAAVWWGAVLFAAPDPLQPIPWWMLWLSRLPYVGLATLFGAQLWIMQRSEGGKRERSTDNGTRYGGVGDHRRVGGVGAGSGQP